MISNWTAWSLVLIAAINSTLGNLMLKKSNAGESANLLELILNPWFFGGLIFYGLNLLLFTKALVKLPVSVAYPILAGVGFILLTLLSSIFFDEKFSLLQWVGLFFIIFGITLMANVI